jgi:DNA polymerase III alpha subunit (gram-positive type)
MKDSKEWFNLSADEQLVYRLDRKRDKRLARDLILLSEEIELNEEQKEFIKIHRSIPGSERRRLHKLKKRSSGAKLAIDHIIENRKKVLIDFTEKVIQSKKIVCIDVEQHEFSKKLLEVGITEYYPSTNTTVHHHYIIEEYYSKRNRRNVPDNKDNFDFGTSVQISIHNLKQIMDFHLRDAHHVVGHSFSNDVKMLENYMTIDHNKIIDTQNLAKYYFGENRLFSLTSILNNLKIRHENLHNAGNDAAFTMRCLLEMQQFDLEELAWSNNQILRSIAE